MQRTNRTSLSARASANLSEMEQGTAAASPSRSRRSGSVSASSTPAVQLTRSRTVQDLHANAAIAAAAANSAAASVAVAPHNGPTLQAEAAQPSLDNTISPAHLDKADEISRTLMELRSAREAAQFFDASGQIPPRRLEQGRELPRRLNDYEGMHPTINRHIATLTLQVQSLAVQLEESRNPGHELSSERVNDVIYQAAVAVRTDGATIEAYKPLFADHNLPAPDPTAHKRIQIEGAFLGTLEILRAFNEVVENPATPDKEKNDAILVINDVKRSMTLLKSDITALKNEFEAPVKQLQGEIKELQDEIKEFQRQVKTLTKNVRAMTGDAQTTAQRQLNNANTDLTAANANLTAAERRLITSKEALAPFTRVSNMVLIEDKVEKALADRTTLNLLKAVVGTAPVQGLASGLHFGVARNIMDDATMGRPDYRSFTADNLTAHTAATIGSIAARSAATGTALGMAHYSVTNAARPIFEAMFQSYFGQGIEKLDANEMFPDASAIQIVDGQLVPRDPQDVATDQAAIIKNRRAFTGKQAEAAVGTFAGDYVGFGAFMTSTAARIALGQHSLVARSAASAIGGALMTATHTTMALRQDADAPAHLKILNPALQTIPTHTLAPPIGLEKHMEKIADGLGTILPRNPGGVGGAATKIAAAIQGIFASSLLDFAKTPSSIDGTAAGTVIDAARGAAGVLFTLGNVFPGFSSAEELNAARAEDEKIQQREAAAGTQPRTEPVVGDGPWPRTRMAFHALRNPDASFIPGSANSPVMDRIHNGSRHMLQLPQGALTDLVTAGPGIAAAGAITGAVAAAAADPSTGAGAAAVAVASAAGGAIAARLVQAGSEAVSEAVAGAADGLRRRHQARADVLPR